MKQLCSRQHYHAFESKIIFVSEINEISKTRISNAHSVKAMYFYVVILIFFYKIYNYVQIMKLNKTYFLCTNVDYLKQINNNENLCLLDFF